MLVPALKELNNIIEENDKNLNNFGYNKITDIGIEKLVPALKEMKGMTRLYLQNNITDIGIEKLVPALKEMKGMTVLELHKELTKSLILVLKSLYLH